MTKWNFQVPWSRGEMVNPGVRFVLLGVNTFLVLTGASMVVLGVKVAQHNKLMSPAPLPDLWWLGVMPLTIGITGMVCTVIGHPRSLLSWAIYSTLAGSGSFIYFIRTGSLNPETFGISKRIYDTCSDRLDMCLCIWPSSSSTTLHRYTCQMLRVTESIYLSQMILMTLSLVASIVGCFLASIATCCYSCCTDEIEEERALLVSRTLTLNNLSNGEKQSPDTCQYKTDYVSPNKTRTYVAETEESTSTML